MIEKKSTTEKRFREDRNAEERATAESESRPARLERLRSRVEAWFPGEKYQELRQEIERSFRVPQWGAYHNEGLLMDTHIDAILDALDRTKKGEFPSEIPEHARSLLRETVATHKEELERYVFLHDISKADLLRIQFEKSEQYPKGLAWEGNLEQWHEENNVPEDARTDPAQLYQYLAGQNIKGISYYHKGGEVPEFNRKTESKKHGGDGKEKLERFEEYGVSDATLVAIANHEVAYQFQDVNVTTYKRFFGSMSEEERNLSLVASYVDTSGSWNREGNPDLANFINLMGSKHTYELYEAIEMPLLQDEALDKQKVEQFLISIRKSKTGIAESADALLGRAKMECKKSEYDIKDLESNLAELVQSSNPHEQITSEEAATVIQAARSGDLSNLGRIFQRRYKGVKIALKASEKK